MHGQQFSSLKQPGGNQYRRQLDLEDWCVTIGADRALRDGWQVGASNSLADRFVDRYLQLVVAHYWKSRMTAVQLGHVFDLLRDEATVKECALEAYYYVFSNVADDVQYSKIANSIGIQMEYALWLSDPEWSKSVHLNTLRLMLGRDLSIGLAMKRLTDAGFRKASAYKPLMQIERISLGAFFLETMIIATGLFETYEKLGFKSRRKFLRYTDPYWDYLKRWREAAAMFRPARLPMVHPPKPWVTHDDGGYLRSRIALSPVGWERWPEVSRRAEPCLLGAVNRLQAQPYRLDYQGVALLEALWNLGHAIGGFPSRERLPEPRDAEFRAAGLGPSAFWDAVYRWKADRSRDPARSAWINCQVGIDRLRDEGERADLFMVNTIDRRGRIYTRSGQLTPHGPDHVRSVLRFAQESPVKGHERAFAWSLGEAFGLPPDPEARLQHLEDRSEAIARCGEDPLGNLAYIQAAKKPFRFQQLCRDWHGYRQDPGYTSGTIHWLDQTCSGWGHLACLTGDGVLAGYTNVIGSKLTDLYAEVGALIVERINWSIEHDPLITDRTRECLVWWAGRELPRSLWKNALMPVIYGRSHLSLTNVVSGYVRNEVGQLVSDDGLRVGDLVNALAMLIGRVVKECLPHAGDLGRWLGSVAKLQHAAGQLPSWYTPNGFLVESAIYEMKREKRRLTLSGRTVQLSMMHGTGVVDLRRCLRKLTPDFIHSFDAAFLQRFVHHWDAYGWPISAVHDCFGTDLQHAETLGHELRDQLARFYSVDWLTRHQGAVSAQLGVAVPSPPRIGSLDASRIGENPFIFS